MKQSLGLGIVAAASFAAGAGATLFYDSYRIADRDEKIVVYRAAFGTDRINGFALMELSNPELNAASMIMVARLRAMCAAYEIENRRIAAQREDGVLDQHEASEQASKLFTATSEEFNKTLRRDNFQFQYVIRKRIGLNQPGSGVGLLLDWEPPPTSAGTICAVADETERLMKQLPKS